MARASSEDEMRPMPFDESMKPASNPAYIPQRPNKKWMILILSVVSFIACMVFASLYGVDYDAISNKTTSETTGSNNVTEDAGSQNITEATSSEYLPETTTSQYIPETTSSLYIPEPTGFAELPDLSTFEEEKNECGKRDQVANMTLWNEAVEKTSYLIEDKFTIALQTYKRPTQLTKTLAHLTAVKIPSLYEIVVVWNDLETMPPEDYISEGTRVPVRFRRSEQNSLNQKLLPDPAYMTQGVLLSDDDWNYNMTDLDWVFQSWRRAGMHRLTGAFARCWHPNKKGEPIYAYCRHGVDHYQMVLTGLAFSHMSFLEYYWSEDPLMIAIRDYVDEKMNCEDIALNFMASMLTCEGPLQAFGNNKLDHQAARTGISTKPGHGKRRNACLKKFIKLFEYMPLHDVETYLRRGALPVG